MIQKIFSILFGFFSGLFVYSFVGYIFTKKTSIGKKYQKMMFLFIIFLILIIFLYQIVK